MGKTERELLTFLKEYHAWQKEKFPLQKQMGWLLKVDEEYKEFQAELKKKIRNKDKIKEEAADYLFVIQGLRDYSPALADHLQSTFFLLYSKMIFQKEFIDMMKEKFERNKMRIFRFFPVSADDGYYKGSHIDVTI